MDTSLRPAEVFPPGEHIRDELEARGWRQEDLCRVLGRPIQAINEIITGKKSITAKTALGLSQAFGTSPQFWLNLEVAYRLFRAPQPDTDVARRAKLFSLVPVRQIQRCGWLPAFDPKDTDRLEQALCEFLGISSSDQKPDVRFAARVACDDPDYEASQMAWICRVRSLASTMTVSRYSASSLEEALPSLPKLSVNTQDAAKLPTILSKHGVRLLFVPHLPRTKIDGAAFWLDRRSPVVALSFRYARVDYFWFTLMHELAHVVCGHASKTSIIDNALFGESRQEPTTKTAEERRADRMATEWLVPGQEFSGFVRCTRPYFSERKITSFATSLGIHPGIVVGRLQHEGLVGWGHLRRLLGSEVKRSVEAAGMLDDISSSLLRSN